MKKLIVIEIILILIIVGLCGYVLWEEKMLNEQSTQFLILFSINSIIIITMFYTTKWNKRMDITNHYMTRYDVLIRERQEINMDFNKNEKSIRRKKLENPEKKEWLGKNGRRRVLNEFTWDKIAENTISLYEKMVKD